MDSLKTILRFVEKDGSSLIARDRALQEKVKATLDNVNELDDKLAKIKDIQQYLRERRQYLKEQLEKYGLGKYLKKLNKDVYYFSQLASEYRNILSDSKEAERKVLAMVRQMPAFQKFMNASIDDIAYSSFEAINSGGVVSQQTNTGGWLINPGSTIVTDRSLTGKFSFSGRLDKTVAHQGNYTVTLWGHSWGTVTANGQAGTMVANVGDWRLFKWDLTNVSSVTILADNVDEVRLYPANARMTTYTYNPLIGKSSECDQSNRITYYEYDDLGRLQFVRDENKNVLKMYEYNYKH